MDTTLLGMTIHEEHQSFVIMRIMALAVVLALGVTAILVNWKQGVTDPNEVWSLALVGVMILLALWGFSSLRVTVTNTELRFGYPIWHRRVPVSQIQVGDVVRIPFWYGIGLHYVGRMWVYNARLGRGVMITIKGRRYLIGSDDPERLQAALLQVAPPRNHA